MRRQHRQIRKERAGNTASADRFERQAALYSFPYHWIPVEDAGRWTLGRSLVWGHEYLAVLTTVRNRALSLRPNRVLDIGCGDGRLAHELLRAGVLEFVGIDLVEQALAFARAFNSEHLARATFLQKQVHELNEQEFDLAIAMETLEHVPEEEIPDLVRSVWERLKGDSFFLISVPTSNIPLNPKHERHYTPQLLEKHLKPWFELADLSFIHSTNTMEKVLRRIWVNRVWLVRDSRILDWLTRLYSRYVLKAREWDGAHIVALFRRRNP